MKKYISLFLSVVLLLSCVTGCGSKAPDEAADGDKVMKVGIPALTNTFDYWQTASGYDLSVIANVYDTLLILDENNQYTGSLAESWSVADDNMTYTFNLRHGVKFSDGSEFTSADVKFSLEGCIKCEGLSWLYQSLIESVETPDDYTVVIKTPTVTNQLLVILSNSGYNNIISKAAYEKYGDDYGKSAEAVVGTGPYRVSEWTYGESLTLVSNEDYHLGAPDIKTITFEQISDPNAALISLQTNEIDLYFDDVPGVSISDVENNADLSIAEFTSFASYNIYMNCEEGMFADTRMRQAVAYAIDKQGYCDVGNEGHGILADYPGDIGPVLQGNPELDKTWYEQDLEKARALVKEAGNEGKSVTIYCISTGALPTIATMLQSTLTELGLNATVQQMERTSFNESVISNADYEIMVSRFVGSLYDIDESLLALDSNNFGSGGNYGHYVNPEMDALIAQSRQTLDESERKEICAQIMELYNEDMPFTILFYSMGSRAYSNRITLTGDQALAQRDHLRYYSWAE